MMMTDKTPVALFVYNRPSHTRRALEALSKCSGIDECEFYFFADGPRTEDIRPQVEATRKILKEWAERFDANIVEQDENLGLARSIVSGVTELCKRYGRVIVLEDDLVVGVEFLHYMLASLARYENEEKVMQVGAFTLSSPNDLATDVFLLPVTTTWGWATWERAWQHFSWQPDDLERAESDKKWCRLFDLNGTGTYSKMLEDRLAGRNDSWGILWWYAVSRHQGLVTYPRNSLVWNIGFDGSGVHCGDNDFTGQNTPSTQVNTNFPKSPSFPPETAYNPLHLSQLEDFLRSHQGSMQPGESTMGVCRKLTNLAKNVTEKVRNALY